MEYYVRSMPTLEFRSPMPVSPAELFAWHGRPGALQRLIPPWQDVRVIEQRGGIADGAGAVISIPFGPVHVKWVARHQGYEPPRQFQDVQVKGPFKSWVHTHCVLPDENSPASTGSILCDHLDYQLPMGSIGNLLGGGLVKRQIESAFGFRHRRTRSDLHRHARFPGRRLRVAITGASGFIGEELKHFLTTGGHEVQVLVRRAAENTGEISWNPAAGTIDAAALENLDAVVNVAGESIMKGRWSDARKKRYVSSRVDSTRLLCGALARLKNPPRVLVSASATGFYGDRGETSVDESSPKGAGFLPDLCQAWEGATQTASDAGIRVVSLRFGIVLSPRGGALRQLLTPFKLGLGGVIGSGKQYMSWIAIDDAIGAIHESIFTQELKGPVNAVSPTPMTNRDFVKTLASVLHRPAFFPVPSPMVNLAFGEKGRTVLLEGARVLPTRLQSAGFEFFFPTLRETLEFQLGKQIAPQGQRMFLFPPRPGTPGRGLG
jgi:hypothetical protein